TWQDQRPIPLKPDYVAITWLQDHVAGSPVILEGRGRLYSWANRVSIYTGLPTVLGWDWHEIQQRGLFGDQDIQKRAADVTNMYVGFATSKLSFSRIHLERVGQMHNTHYQVVLRETLYKSDAWLTPRRSDTEVDSQRLAALVAETFDEAGIDPNELEGGAIIL